MLGISRSKRLKVAALNLFHLTASPPFPKPLIFHIATQSHRGEGGLLIRMFVSEPVRGPSVNRIQWVK